MPVTFKVADHESKAWTKYKVTSREDLFAQTCCAEHYESSRIIQSSITHHTFHESYITPSPNGFVYAAFDAYNQHHHLTIRPDDIWFAILSQLNFYINKHAEELRNKFVAHEGRKELIIQDVGSIETVDFGVFARRMTGLIQENVKDPNLRDWIMPTFSTTTVDDRTTAAVLMMGSLQEYFSYTCDVMCGIPSVTLLGERADYEDIYGRLDKLEELGQQTADWAKLLRPVLRRFISSFDEEMTAEVKGFWTKIAHWEGGSGMSRLSGWLTAFCFWRNDGESLHHYDPLKSANPERQHSTEPGHNVKRPRYELDSVMYHSLELDDIPSGFASVPVMVDDNGIVYNTKMVAGSMGISVGTSTEDGEEKLDKVRSLSGWVMYELKKKGERSAASPA